MNLEETILDIHGKVAEQRYTETVLDEEGNEKSSISSRPLTLGNAISDSVLLQISEGEEVTEKSHLLRYGIYEKVKNGNSNFTRKELKLIKKCIAKRYTPLFAGQFLRMLKQKSIMTHILEFLRIK
jgi:hypothetical protein